MPPKPVKTIAMSANFAKILKGEISSIHPLSPGLPASAVRRPTLWAASFWWDCYSLAPWPLQVQAYDSNSTTFANDHQSIKLIKNGDQFLMTAVVSIGLYDAGISQVDFTHNLSMWGGLQTCGISIQGMNGRNIASAYSPQENITHSNPPEKILSFTTYFEAWQDNEELKLHATGGYSHPSDHPVKLWARLINLWIVKL
jgi:hypothetical protein